MKNSSKKVMLLTLSLALVLTLGACAMSGGGTQPPAAGSDTGAATAAETPAAAEEAPAAAPSDEAIDLSIMWWGPDPRHEATVKALDLYTAEVKPNITFTHEYMAWDGYWAKLVVLAASRTMTDILQMDAQYIDNYVTTNQLADISAIDFGGIIPNNVLDNMKINGVLYGAPVGRNGAALVYNKTALDEYGISLPKEGWNWDEYFAWVDEAREKLPAGLYPIGDWSSSWDGYQFYQVAMNGGRVIDGPILNLKRDLWFDFNQRMATYRAEGKVPTPEESMSFAENDAQLDPLASGKVMLVGRTVGQVGALVSLMPDSEIGVVNYPIGPGGGGWAQATMFLSVGENSSHKPEAMEFIHWFLTDLDAGEILMTVRGLPLSDEVFAAIEPKLQPADLLGRALYNVTANNNPTPFLPSSIEFADFVTGTQGFYRATMEQVMFGMISLEDAYEKLIAKGEELGAAA